MRSAVRGVTSLRSIRMRERAYNFMPIFESGGAHAAYCTNDCQYCQSTRRKLNSRMRE
jgi:hypothetical protein